MFHEVQIRLLIVTRWFVHTLFLLPWKGFHWNFRLFERKIRVFKQSREWFAYFQYLPSGTRRFIVSAFQCERRGHSEVHYAWHRSWSNAWESKGLSFYRRSIGCSAPMTREKSWRSAPWHHYGPYKKKEKKSGKRANCISARKIWTRDPR